MQPWNRYAVAVALCCIAGSACAEGFAARVAKGNTAMETADGKKYEAQIRPLIRLGIMSCIPAGSMQPANVGTFNYVANVRHSGALSAVEYQPVTKVSTCFAGQMAKAHFPPPPSPGFPITIEMNVKP